MGRGGMTVCCKPGGGGGSPRSHLVDYSVVDAKRLSLCGSDSDLKSGTVWLLQHTHTTGGICISITWWLRWPPGSVLRTLGVMARQGGRGERGVISVGWSVTWVCVCVCVLVHRTPLREPGPGGGGTSADVCCCSCASFLLITGRFAHLHVIPP